MPCSSICPLPALRALAFVLAALAIVPPSIAQDDGSLDPHFGGGFVFLESVAAYTAAHDGLALEDGVLLAGRDGIEAILLKVGRDGEAVETFGVEGRTATKLAGTALSWNAVAELPDGRFLAAGAAFAPGGAPVAVAARFSPDGVLDLDYGDDGLRLLPELGTGAAAVAVLPTGGSDVLVVGGRWRATTSNAAPPEPGTQWQVPPAPEQTVVARLDAEGALVESYGDGGTATLALSGEFVAAADAVLQVDGSVVLAGEIGTPGSPFFGDWFAARIDPDGVPDDVFGLPRIDFGGSIEYATSVAVDDAGRVVIAGARATQFANALAFARFSPTGDLDPAFGDGGIAAFPDEAVGFFVLAFDLVVTPEGVVTFVGSRSNSFLTSDVLLGRLRPDGSLDPVYGKGGVTSLNFQPGDQAFALAPDLDGGYFVGGAATTNSYTESIPFALRLAGPATTDAEASALPRSLALGAPYPNPARGAVTIPVALAVPAVARVAVFDVLGREVAVVHDGPLAAGRRAFAFDAAALPNGLYVVRAEVGERRVTRRLTVVR